MPTIITRAEWGAAWPKRPHTPVDWDMTGDALWVHFSDGPPPADTLEAEARTVRAIQVFHQGPERGWNDIGYGFLVAPSGRIYEGRGVDALAAHCPNHNDEPSVCIMWKSQTELPPKAALDAVLWLRGHLAKKQLRSHREGTPTTCPGNALAAWVVANREAKPVAAVDPWTAYVGGKVIGSGRFYPPKIAFIKALVAAGKNGATITLKYNK